MPTYIRCRDDSTGHHIDVDERSLRPGLTPIAGYPPNSGPGAMPRPPKHCIAKDGTRAARRKPSAVPATPSEPEGAKPS